MQFKGAAVLITGGSSGIGAATAYAVAAAGGRPLVAGRDRARLEAVVAQCEAVAAQCGAAVAGCGGVALEADLAAPEGASCLAEAASRTAPDGVDVLINNAGIGWAGAFGDV
ncbi:MAG: SDR family NAD(P)-dependent oxidoreductase, partial [Micromonosporaceae bacterium]